MSIINKVKEHISSNRGKYGAAAGAGAMYGASKIDSPLVNQAGFNILAKGQNLALDAADKIDPRAAVALNDLGMHKIRQEDIDASNALYNSGVAKFINPNPVDMVNANEHSTELYNKAMAAKASAQEALVNAKNQGQDYLDQGINYVKGLNPFTESTIPGKTMKIEKTTQIPIKKILTEGKFATNEGKQTRALLPATLIPTMAAGGAIGGIVDGLYNSNDGLLTHEPDSQIDGALIGAGLVAPIGGLLAGRLGSDAAELEIRRRNAYFDAKMKDREKRTAHKTKPTPPNFYKGKQ